MSSTQENLQNLAAQSPDGGLDIESFRLMTETILHGKSFQDAYGASRTYYHLYGDNEPVYFLGLYRSPAENAFSTPEDTQKETLNNIVLSHRDEVQYSLPFTMTRIGSQYDFVIGHEANYCAFSDHADFSRGFMISLGGPLTDITIIQHDPGKSRTLFDQDTDPDKRQFVTILLNLLLTGGFNGSESVSAKGGLIHFKKIIFCDHIFRIEKIIHTYLKPYIPVGDRNPLGISRSVTDTNQPWIVNFDVQY